MLQLVHNHGTLQGGAGPLRGRRRDHRRGGPRADAQGLRARRLSRRQKSLHEPRDAAATHPVQSLRGLSRQAPTGGPGAGPAPPEDEEGPPGAGGLRHDRRRRRVPSDRTPGGGGDRGLLPAGGGRPVRLRADRRRERALRHLGHGRHARSSRSTSWRFPTQALPLETLARSSRAGRARPTRRASPSSAATRWTTPSPSTAWRSPGVVHPQAHPHQRRRPPGDVLLLTKPIGSGIATTAIKRGIATPELDGGVVELMSALNRAAGRGVRLGQVQGERAHRRHRLRAAGAPAGDDDSARRRARGWSSSGCRSSPACPRSRSRAWCRAGPSPTSSTSPRTCASPTGCPDPMRWVLADAQTNGGLLAAVPRAALPKAERALARAGVELAVVGELTRGRPRIDVG